MGKRAWEPDTEQRPGGGRDKVGSLSLHVRYGATP